MAGVAVGAVAPDQSWNEVVGTIVSNPEFRERYDRLYSLYRQLYPATSDIVHQLAQISQM
jgi:xylulokinase